MRCHSSGTFFIFLFYFRRAKDMMEFLGWKLKLDKIQTREKIPNINSKGSNHWNNLVRGTVHFVFKIRQSVTLMLCWSRCSQRIHVEKRIWFLGLCCTEKWDQLVTVGSFGFKNLWIKSIAFVPYPVLHWVMSASPVRHLPMHLLWLQTGLLGGMSGTYFCVTVFLFTGGYEYPPPPPYSCHETTTVEQPGMCWGTVFLTTIIILLLTKAKWFWFSSLKMEFSEQSQSKKMENFPRNVGR